MVRQAPLHAVPALVLLAAGALLLARGRRGGAGPVQRSVLLFWLLLPTAVLVLASLSGKHLSLARYLIVSAPAAALVIGFSVVLTGRFSLVVLAALVLLFLPSYL